MVASGLDAADGGVGDAGQGAELLAGQARSFASLAKVKAAPTPVCALGRQGEIISLCAPVVQACDAKLRRYVTDRPGHQQRCRSHDVRTRSLE